MSITILGMDLEEMSNIFIEVQERVQVSVPASQEWSAVFRQECARLGLSGASTGWHIAEDMGDVFFVAVTRRIPLASDNGIDELNGLMSKVRSAVEATNAGLVMGGVEILGAELAPSREAVLTVDLAVEVLIGSLDELKGWIRLMARRIIAEGVSDKVGWMEKVEGNRVRYFLTIGAVSFRYRGGRLEGDRRFIQILKQFSAELSGPPQG